MSRPVRSMLEQRLIKAIVLPLTLLPFAGCAYAFRIFHVFWESYPLATVGVSLVIQTLIWSIGVTAANGIVNTADHLLFPLTPLRTGLYFKRNTVRMLPGLIVLYILAPCLIVCLLRTPRISMPPIDSLWVTSVIFLHYTSFLVPLRECFQGKAGFSACVFSLRQLKLPVFIALFFLFIGEKLVQFNWDKWNELFGHVLDTHILAHVLLLTASPFTELMLYPNTPFAQTMQWAAPLFFLLIQAGCIFDISRALRVKTESIEHGAMEEWLDFREEYEAIEAEQAHAVEESLQEWSESRPSLDKDIMTPTHADAQVDDVILELPEETGYDALPYLASLSPEEQIIRHHNHERSGTGWFYRRFGMLPRASSSYIFLVSAALGGWLCTWLAFELNSATRTEAALGMSHAFIFLFWLPILVAFFRSHCFSSYAGLGHGTTLPLRWPRLVYYNFLYSSRDNVILDFFAVAVCLLLSHYPLWTLPVWLGFLYLHRCSACLMEWINSFRLQKFSLSATLFFVVVITCRGIQVCALALLVVHAEDMLSRSSIPLYMLSPAFLIAGAESLILLTAIPIIVLRIWRKGSTVPAYLQPPKPIIVVCE
jgi:hypothetical protein